MIYALKPAFVARLSSIEDRLVEGKVSANSMTVVGVASGAGIGAALFLGLRFDDRFLFLVPFLCMTRLTANALDGSIARRTKTATPQGAIVNELGDRAGDALMISGASLVDPSLTLAAIAASFICSLTGLLGQTTGGLRLTCGPMGKADRVALLAVAAPMAILVSPAVLEAWLWIVVIGSVLTAGRRSLSCVGGSHGH